MKINDCKIEFTTGSGIQNHISKVANFRIKYFRDFPYLYQGDLDYEIKYLDGYVQDAKAALVQVINEKGELKAVSTALPLCTASDILAGAPELFQQAGYDPKEIYYYGEVILDYEIRGKGFSRQIYELQDRFARESGYQKIAIATVVREEVDVRKPTDYVSSDLVWEKLGFERTEIHFEYNWPTICLDGSVKDMMNPMIYWVKNL